MKINKELRNILVIVILLVTLYIFFRENTVTIYLGIAQVDENIENIEADVWIDEDLIFSGSLEEYAIFKYYLKELKLKSGFHSLRIISNKNNINLEKKFFIIANQHVVIEYYSSCEPDKVACFDVRNRFTMFRLE